MSTCISHCVYVQKIREKLSVNIHRFIYLTQAEIYMLYLV